MGDPKNQVKFRLMGDPAVIEPEAAKLVQYLEKAGYLVVEWSRPYACRPPEEANSRIYVVARVGEGDKVNGAG